jgi:hypothetical protein
VVHGGSQSMAQMLAIGSRSASLPELPLTWASPLTPHPTSRSAGSFAKPFRRSWLLGQ